MNQQADFISWYSERFRLFLRANAHKGIFWVKCAVCRMMDRREGLTTKWSWE